MGSEKPLGTHDMGFSKNLEIRRMVLPTGCDQIIHWFRVALA
jgi:hypothetical protein